MNEMEAPRPLTTHNRAGGGTWPTLPFTHLFPLRAAALTSWWRCVQVVWVSCQGGGDTTQTPPEIPELSTVTRQAKHEGARCRLEEGLGPWKGIPFTTSKGKLMHCECTWNDYVDKTNKRQWRHHNTEAFRKLEIIGRPIILWKSNQTDTKERVK